MAIVYRHRRLDTNEIFYVGISTNSKRPYNKNKRSNFWKKIITKTNYEVEILYENISYDDAKELEIFLISLYGRKNLELGSLVNLTDGGDGNVGWKMKEETKSKIAEKAKGRKAKQEVKDKFSLIRKGKKHSEETKKKQSLSSGRAKEVICTETGKAWRSIRECAKDLGINYSVLKNKLNNQKENNTKLRQKNNELSNQL